MMPTPIGQEPKMIRTGTGRMVPVSRPFGAVKNTVKRFLVVIQHYDGDVVFAEELASLIADLERTRNHDADILLVRRADSRQMSTTVINKLQSKFDTVHTHTCRRFAKGHPYGCNEMWYDLVMLVGQQTPFRDDYFAFIPLESDAVPTRPGWIGELIREWSAADTEGKAAVGFIHNDPRPHMNGVAVYAANLYTRVGSGILRGGSPQVPYDIRHSGSILPLAKETPLIRFQYRRPTISPAELFAEPSPAIFHGVKDRSALMAVRDRHINMKAPAPITVAEAQQAIVDVITNDVRAEIANTPPPPKHDDLVKNTTNVYTYFHKLTGTTIENQTILDLWRKGWATRGWNPIILTFADAVKNPKFPDFEEALAKLPCATDRKRWVHQFYRWLALESKGGGLLTDYDALPAVFTPEILGDNSGPRVMFKETGLMGMWLKADHSTRWIESIMKYDAQPDDMLNDKPHVTDRAIALRSPNAAVEEYLAPMKHFATDAKERKSVAMERFLSGK